MKKKSSKAPAYPAPDEALKAARNFRAGGELYLRGRVYSVPAAVAARHRARFVAPQQDL